MTSFQVSGGKNKNILSCELVEHQPCFPCPAGRTGAKALMQETLIFHEEVDASKNGYIQAQKKNNYRSTFPVNGLLDWLAHTGGVLR